MGEGWERVQGELRESSGRVGGLQGELRESSGRVEGKLREAPSGGVQGGDPGTREDTVRESREDAQAGLVNSMGTWRRVRQLRDH